MNYPAQRTIWENYVGYRYKVSPFTYDQVEAFDLYHISILLLARFNVGLHKRLGSTLFNKDYLQSLRSCYEPQLRSDKKKICINAIKEMADIMYAQALNEVINKDLK